MLVEYKKLKYGYTAEGWEQAYQNEYKDLQNLRLKLLIEDEAIGEVLQDIYKIMLDFRLQTKPINVLDIGCGVGHQLCAISHLCDNSLGFDISEEVVKNNNALNCAARFLRGDALNHPDLGQKSNIVLMAGVLYAIDENRETHRRILSEAYNSLSEDGFFIFYHRAYLNVLTYLDKKLANLRNRDKDGTDYYMCWFDDAYILSLLDEIGFKAVSVKKADFAYPLNSTVFRKLFVKRKYWDYDSYRSYNHYNKEYNSYKRLNFLGQFMYILSRHVFNTLSARTSIFILQKR